MRDYPKLDFKPIEEQEWEINTLNRIVEEKNGCETKVKQQ